MGDFQQKSTIYFQQNWHSHKLVLNWWWQTDDWGYKQFGKSIKDYAWSLLQLKQLNIDVNATYIAKNDLIDGNTSPRRTISLTCLW